MTHRGASSRGGTFPCAMVADDQRKAKAMKLELKNIKHAEFASEETNCFEATLYVDGKRFALVSNEGRGGPDMVYPADRKVARNDKAFWTRVDDINAFLAKSEAGKAYAAETNDLGYDLEAWCGDQLDRWLLTKQARRVFSGHVMWVENGGVYQAKLRGGGKVTPEVREQIAAKHPERKWLMTVDAVVEEMV